MEIVRGDQNCTQTHTPIPISLVFLRKCRNKTKNGQFSLQLIFIKINTMFKTRSLTKIVLMIFLRWDKEDWYSRKNESREEKKQGSWTGLVDQIVSILLFTLTPILVVIINLIKVLIGIKWDTSQQLGIVSEHTCIHKYYLR